MMKRSDKTPPLFFFFLSWETVWKLIFQKIFLKASLFSGKLTFCSEIYFCTV